MPTRTYTGFAPTGHLVLPDRQVPFVNGEPVEFTAEEVDLLPEEWVTPGQAKKATKPRKRAAKKADTTTPDEGTTEEPSDG